MTPKIHIHHTYFEHCGNIAPNDSECTNQKDVNCPECRNAIARAELVEAHAKAMLNTLRLPKNACKGHWADKGIHDMLQHLESEHSEFVAAVWGYLHHGDPIENVINEGSDLSNVAAMITDNLIRKKY